MGAEAEREVYPLTGFFSLSLLYSFEVLVAMAWIRYRTDRNMSIFERKKKLYFSRLKTMLNSGNDSTRIRKAKGRIYFIFPWRDEYLFFSLMVFLPEESKPMFLLFLIFMFCGIVHAGNKVAIRHPGHVTAL